MPKELRPVNSTSCDDSRKPALIFFASGQMASRVGLSNTARADARTTWISKQTADAFQRCQDIATLLRSGIGLCQQQREQLVQLPEFLIREPVQLVLCDDRVHVNLLFRFRPGLSRSFREREMLRRHDGHLRAQQREAGSLAALCICKAFYARTDLG